MDDSERSAQGMRVRREVLGDPGQPVGGHQVRLVQVARRVPPDRHRVLLHRVQRQEERRDQPTGDGDQDQGRKLLPDAPGSVPVRRRCRHVRVGPCPSLRSHADNRINGRLRKCALLLEPRAGLCAGRARHGERRPARGSYRSHVFMIALAKCHAYFAVFGFFDSPA